MRLYTVSDINFYEDEYLGNRGQANFGVHSLYGVENKVAQIALGKYGLHADKLELLMTLFQTFRKDPILCMQTWPMIPFYDDEALTNLVGVGTRRDLLIEHRKMREMSTLANLTKWLGFHPDGFVEQECFTQRDLIDSLILICETVSMLHIRRFVIGIISPHYIGRTESGATIFTDLFNMAPEPNHATQEDYRLKLENDRHIRVYLPAEYHSGESRATSSENEEFIFTRDSDRFGLAVTIYEVLFAMKHPFSPKPECVDNDREIITNILKGRPRYDSREIKLMRKEGTPLFSDFPDYLQDVFRRAFDGASATLPTPWEWVSVLKKYREELVACQKDPRHWYWSGADTCPYCKENVQLPPAKYWENIFWD